MMREAAVSRALETNVWKCSICLTNLGAHWSSCTWQSHHTQLSLFTLKGSINRVIDCGSLVRWYLKVCLLSGSGFMSDLRQGWPQCSIVVTGLYCNCILPEPSCVTLFSYLFLIVSVACPPVLPAANKGQVSKLTATAAPPCSAWRCIFSTHGDSHWAAEKKRYFAASLYGLGGRHSGYLYSALSNHVLYSAPGPGDHEKALQQLLCLMSANYT